jgi:hypothetical protein
MTRDRDPFRIPQAGVEMPPPWPAWPNHLAYAALIEAGLQVMDQELPQACCNAASRSV